jgi:hypothetical protein
MAKDKTRIFVTEFVEHIFVVDTDKLDEEIDRIELDFSWKVKPVGEVGDDYRREQTHFNLEVE